MTATLPAGIVDDLVRATDGVPLFVEEFTRTVSESPVGQLLAQGSSAIGADMMPGTLRDLLMTRLDNLGPTKDVAQVAAVLGRTFEVEMLAAVLGTTVEALAPDLARLAAADLIFEESGERRGTYLFKHALLRDAAYDALLRRRRRDIHGRVAAALERSFPATGATHPEVLAYHLTEALQLDAAITWWERAARHAIRSYAGEEAIRHLRHALELLARLPAAAETLAREADLCVALCSALYMTKGTGAAEVGEALTRARDVCERAERHSDLHLVLYMLAGFHNLRAEYADGQRVAGDALALADLPRGWSEAFPRNGARRAPRHARGVPVVERRLRALPRRLRTAMAAAGASRCGFVQVGMAHPSVVAHCNAAFALWFLGFPDQAVTTVTRGLALVPVRDTTQSYSLCFAQGFVAQMRLYRREGDLALAEADRLIALARECGMQYWLDTGHLLRAGALVLASQGAAALTTLEAAFAASQGTETRISTSMWLGILASAQALMGRTTEALGWLRAGLAFAADRKEGAWYPELCRLEGVLLLTIDSDARDAAEACFREAIRAARAQGGLSWELRAAVNLATLLRGTSRGEEAYEDLARVYARFTEGFDTPDLLEAGTRLAELASAQSRSHSYR